MTYWYAGQKITGARLEHFIQRGSEQVSFTALDSFVQDVDFPVGFDVAPVMAVNINSGAGETGRWDARAINVSPTGFQLFVFANAAGATATWSNIVVQWIAVAP